MLQGFLWLFDDPVADLLLVSTFILVALQFRQLRLLQRRTDALASEVYELKMLVRTISYVPEAADMIRISSRCDWKSRHCGPDWYAPGRFMVD
ncbi:hypothetical protein [Bradyrhizobium murdochi]|uniref:hypothetical protein n=1 Tax=Bradyrhizobium murdochi TaxID=1038859 RepID=UPI000484F85C|nr:hypothetical protein [Bradyrhizobium murdochi]